MVVEGSDLKYAEEFARIAHELHRDGAEQPTLERVTTLAVQTIGGCDYCGISMRDSNGQVTTAASTDPIADQADAQQYELGEGPCLEAIWTFDTCLVDDMSSEARWPRWAAEASRLGIGSVLSIRLDPPRGHLHAALNLYSARPRAFDITDHAVASIFARHAANAMSAAKDRDQLEGALRTRQIIGIAEGMLIQRFGLTLDQSFELLRRYSQDHNIKIRVLAENLLRSGGIPESGSGSGHTTERVLQQALGINSTIRLPQDG